MNWNVILEIFAVAWNQFLDILPMGLAAGLGCLVAGLIIALFRMRSMTGRFLIYLAASFVSLTIYNFVRYGNLLGPH